MDDFFNNIENIDTEDMSPKHWDMSFEIRILTNNSYNLNYDFVIKLLNRNINSLNFRNSEITEYEIVEDKSYVTGLPARRVMSAYNHTYKKTIVVNFNGSIHSDEDAIELLSAVVFTKDEQSEISLCNTLLDILLWKDGINVSDIEITDDCPHIFRKNKTFTVNRLTPRKYTKAIIDTNRIVHSMIGDKRMSFYRISYLLNTYILGAAVSASLLKEHRLLIEAEDCLPENSTLHGYSTLDVANIPFSWSNEDTTFVANSSDPSKNYHCPKTDKSINMSVLGDLFFNTPKDILVTISLNNIQTFEGLPDIKRVRDEKWWKEVYLLNDNIGVCIVDSNKDIEHPLMVNTFLNHYKSELRHSRNMERHMQMFHNPKKNTTGLVMDLCMYYVSLTDRNALVTLGLYGNTDCVSDIQRRLLNL